ncbi:anthrone oxygenase family protein, partial [Kineococcus esterisolvens]|uniref:anthrone oxygenase family protein n=1 Tax=Kineococcus sp. SYSU DK031 TaxID=3383152 RepID=UPI003D7DDAE2
MHPSSTSLLAPSARTGGSTGTSTATRVLCGLAGAGAAVTAGVYTHFSLTVMPRLAALPAEEGIRAMQAFNRQAVQPPFMLCFFGAAALSCALLVRAARRRRSVATRGAAGAAGAYLAGFAITVVLNVPRNDALAALDPTAAASAAVWGDYLREWTSANSVRAVLSGLATAGLAPVALQPGPPRTRHTWARAAPPP